MHRKAFIDGCICMLAFFLPVNLEEITSECDFLKFGGQYFNGLLVA